MTDRVPIPSRTASASIADLLYVGTTPSNGAIYHMDWVVINDGITNGGMCQCGAANVAYGHNHVGRRSDPFPTVSSDPFWSRSWVPARPAAFSVS